MINLPYLSFYSGMVSKKNETNIMVKNALDVIFGGLSYWMFGFAFSRGESEGFTNPFSGVANFFADAKDEVNCPFIGCTGLGVVGSETHPPANSEGLSLMMFPRCDGLEVRDFYIPLRNKYKKISGVKSFLPDMSLPVKLVIVLAHPLSLGKLTNLTVALRSKYGEEVSFVELVT